MGLGEFMDNGDMWSVVKDVVLPKGMRSQTTTMIFSTTNAVKAVK